MKILEIRPEQGAGSIVARFDAEVTPHIRLYNLKLIEGPRGRRVHAPQAFGTNVATFHPSLAEELTRAASAALVSENAGARNASD